MDNQYNSSYYNRALKIFPGAVHSPVRSFFGLDQNPQFFQSAMGAYLYDTQNRQFMDFCLSFGPLILGHAHPKVKEKLHSAIENGWTFGAADTLSLELGEYVLEALSQTMPNMQQIRFVNSGTEAVMSAIRLSRGYTKRYKIIKFNGCYHGHCDSMLIKAGSGANFLSQTSSAGVPAHLADDTLCLDLNDIDSLEECFGLYKDQIAAVIIEPLPLNSGLLEQERSFLLKIRQLTKDNGSLLIFDEVYTGFRFGLGGFSSYLEIIPDLITYGKIIGGGMPIGAICGASQLMQLLAPIGPVYQAGTLSANAMSMVAGLATIKELSESNYRLLEEYSKKIVNIFDSWLKTIPFKGADSFQIIRKGSFFWFYPEQGVPRSLKDLPSSLLESFKPLFKILFDKGIYLSPNPYEVNFISLAHDEKIQDHLHSLLFS